AMPLHNFNVPARLKDYIDNILVARETFRYTENGSVGLMTDNYRVMLLQASGSIYTRNDRYTPMEFSRLYLDKMFTEIMGFDRFEIVRAQGLQTRLAFLMILWM
ncbi:FMN-dependent NADH-azoreductase, partial [Lactiplantibacillus plantarum]